MKFDMLCNIVLEGKKAEKFARIVVTNPTPTFSIDDVLRDPSDPSKGVKTYLDEQLKGSETGEPVDEERIARRALRRLNWVSGSLIKRLGEREIDLRKLHLSIIILLEKYLTNVMRYSEEQIDKLELKIAKEAAFIGNILLPPTKRMPSAKGVFSIAKDSIDFKPVKGQEEEFNLSVADRLSKEFNMTVDEYVAAFDPDLIGTIKDVIKDLSSTQNQTVSNDMDEEPGSSVDSVPDTEEDEGEFVPGSIGARGKTSIMQDIIQDVYNAQDIETAKNIIRNRVENSRISPSYKRTILHNVNTINNLSKLKSYVTNSMFSRLGMGGGSKIGESVSSKTVMENVSVSNILRDPRIKNVYDPRIVKKVIKSMISLGSIKTTEDGRLTLAEPGTEDWRVSLHRARNRAQGVEDTSVPAAADEEDLSQTFSDVKRPPVEAEPLDNDENDEDVIDSLRGGAAARLGYRNADEEEPEEGSDDEGDEWFK